MAAPRKGGTPPSKAKPKAAAKKSAPKPASYDNHFWSIVLFAIGVLIMLLTLIQGNSGWYAMHRFIRGLFGISVFFVSPIMIYASIIIALDKTKETIKARIIQGVIMTLLTSSIIQVIFVGDIRGESLRYRLEMLYLDGVDLKGGGLLSGIVGLPLMHLFGDIGAKIIILLLLFIFIMLLANITLIDFFNIIRKPFREIKHSMKRVGEEISEREFVDKYDEIEEPEEIESGIKEIVVEEKKRRKRIDRSVKDEEEPEPVPVKAEPKQSDNDLTADIYKILGNGNRSYAEKLPEPKFTNDLQIDVPLIATMPREKKNIDIIKSVNAIQETNNTSVREREPEPYIQFDEDKPEKQATVSLLKEEENSYKFPPIDLLKKGTDNSATLASAMELEQTAVTLVDTLKSFGVQTKIYDIHRGPTVTRYELQPSAGVKISRITGLADDIALNLAAAGVRIEAPIPGKAAVGIEVPNNTKDMVSLREMIESEEFRKSESKLSFAVGKDIAGKVIIGDIAKMPHVIIAGATGSGKSVCTNSIIMSILYKATPDEVKLVLIDPKIVEFKVYDGIPHLLIPVVTDPRKAAGALNWAVQEMLKRYKLFADNNVRDLKGYNELAAERDDIDFIPQIVIAIDELADLMMAASNEVEDAICRLAQMARAAGLHLIIATQRPTVDIITGLIKANIPSRIALSVMSQIDSRTILDTGGADKLLGQGDMLYLPSGMPKPIRVQGCFCSTREIEAAVKFIKQEGKPEYSDEVLDEIEKNIPVLKGDKNNNAQADVPLEGDDELIEKAIDVLIEMGQASTSSLQRKLKLGYARAARIMDELEEMGVIGPSEGSKPRKMLMSKQMWAERKMRRLDESEAQKTS